MAHFAKISEDNEVLQVVYMDDKDTQNKDGVEIESEGQYHLEKHNHWPQHLWIKCSYRTKGGKHYENDNQTLSSDQSKAFRKNYPGIGWIWDPENDLFRRPQPYPSWTLNLTTGRWDPPVPKPEPSNEALSDDYEWDENNKNWVLSSRNS